MILNISPQAGKGGPGARPYAVGVGADVFHRLDVVCGIGRGAFGEPRCSRPSYSDGVGARRRQAHPGRPAGRSYILLNKEEKQ